MALWIVQLDSHSTLRSSSVRNGILGSVIISRRLLRNAKVKGETTPLAIAQRLIRGGFSVDRPSETPYLRPTLERVAQPVEHLTFNQRVLGSSPSALTKYFKDLRPAIMPSDHRFG